MKVSNDVKDLVQNRTTNYSQNYKLQPVFKQVSNVDKDFIQDGTTNICQHFNQFQMLVKIFFKNIGM